MGRGTSNSAAIVVGSRTGSEQETYDQAFQRLEQQLLAVGGTRVVKHGIDGDLSLILEAGALFEPTEVVLELGETNRCHSNSARLWEQSRGSLCTGYALSDDGLWRSHSWVWADPELVETTSRRQAYFGVIFNNDQAEVFSANN